MKKNTLYIANDVEAAGHRLGVHSLLSFGASVVTRKPMTYAEMAKIGFLFYAELKPESLAYELAAMKVGCLHLECLEEPRKTDCRFDPTQISFEPELVLQHMQKVCEEPKAVVERFVGWIERLRAELEASEIVGVTDTVFFDGGHFNLFLGKHREMPSPYGWHGIDLTSFYQGYAGRPDAKLKELGVPLPEKPHRADHDAVLLAGQSRKVFFDNLGW